MSGQQPHEERPPGVLWPFVRAHIGDSYEEVVAFLRDPPHGIWAALEARFRQGQAEYGHQNEWLRWSTAKFDDERFSEVLDLILYTAMRRTVFPDHDPAER